MAHNNLSAILEVLGRRDEAISHLREELRIKPDYAQARSNLEVLLKKQAAGGRGEDRGQRIEIRRRVGGFPTPAFPAEAGRRE